MYRVMQVYTGLYGCRVFLKIGVPQNVFTNISRIFSEGTFQKGPAISRSSAMGEQQLLNHNKLCLARISGAA